MVEIIPNIIKHLMNNESVFALFSNRITGDDVPDGQAYPYAYLWEVASPQQYHFNGTGGRAAKIQCDVISDSIIGADLGKRTINDALSGFRGYMGDLNVGHCFVNTVSVPKEVDQRAYRRILEIEVATND